MINLEILCLKIDVSCVHDIKPALGLLGTFGAHPSCFSPLCGTLRRNSFRTMPSHMKGFSLSAWSPFFSNPVFGSLAEVRACLLWPRVALYFLSAITLPEFSPFPPLLYLNTSFPKGKSCFPGVSSNFWIPSLPLRSCLISRL